LRQFVNIWDSWTNFVRRRLREATLVLVIFFEAWMCSVRFKSKIPCKCKRNPFTHETLTVNGIDERVGAAI
jgi:hypothetical protein